MFLNGLQHVAWQDTDETEFHANYPFIITIIIKFFWKLRNVKHFKSPWSHSFEEDIQHLMPWLYEFLLWFSAF